MDDTDDTGGPAFPETDYAITQDEEAECPRCGLHVEADDILDGRCGECRLHEDECDEMGW